MPVGDWCMQYIWLECEQEVRIHRVISPELQPSRSRTSPARSADRQRVAGAAHWPRLRSDCVHGFVHPRCSAEHAGLQTFRGWLLDEARAYAAQPSPIGAARMKSARKTESAQRLPPQAAPDTTNSQVRFTACSGSGGVDSALRLSGPAQRRQTSLTGD